MTASPSILRQLTHNHEMAMAAGAPPAALGRRLGRSTAGRRLHRASPSWGGGYNSEASASGHACSVPPMEGHGFRRATPSSSDGSDGDMKPATAAPTGSPSSRSRGCPEVVIDLTQDDDKGKGKKPVPAMEGPEMHTTQRHYKKQVLLSISAFSFLD